MTEEKKAIPKPTRPQPLPRWGGWRLTPEELEALRKPPKAPPRARHRAQKKPPKAPPTVGEMMAPHIDAMRQCAELKLDRIKAYGDSLDLAARKALLADSIRMTNSVAMMTLYSTADGADILTLENAILGRSQELERLKERALSASERERSAFNVRTAFLQSEIATFSLILQYVKKAFPPSKDNEG